MPNVPFYQTASHHQPRALSAIAVSGHTPTGSGCTSPAQAPQVGYVSRVFEMEETPALAVKTLKEAARTMKEVKPFSLPA